MSSVHIYIYIVLCCQLLSVLFQSYRWYPELFGETWKAFSQQPLQRLSDFEGKRVRNSLSIEGCVSKSAELEPGKEANTLITIEIKALYFY